MVPTLTYPEAMVVGLIQGVTELFPLSSLGHNVLIPALVGGQWAQDLNVSKPESPYLAYIVGLHVATAIAMIIYFWRDWLRIIGGFFSSIWRRRIETADQKLAWMIVIATIPVGVAGLALEHLFRTTFSKPTLTAIFLAVNGLVLFSGERLRRREAAGNQPSAGGGRASGLDPALAPGGHPMARGSAVMTPRGGPLPGQPMAYASGWDTSPRAAGPRSQIAGRHSAGQRAVRQQEASEAIEADGRLSRMGFAQAVVLGTIQVFALLPGISRDGVVMVGGMFRGLSRQDAARFSFLLSAPVILAAGVLKI
ncbi:MAG TPA: undecaprenyl-diphosphate phosphatase, partial [Streptosporangiaceae bacterium]|nr:undecaprenyl-diphosphate phosphatase [Streptosporangiaceae bacterium]